MTQISPADLSSGSLARLEKLVELRELIDQVENIATHDSSLLEETVLHLGRGQETVPVALSFVRNAEDVVFSTHRGMEHAWACGIPLHEILTETLGRVGGPANGRSGHMHLIDLERGFGGTNAIVAGNLPLAAGMALAMKQRSSSGVCFAMMGDGAANTGQFHETLNISAIWALPVVYICENNGWAEMTPSAEVTSGSGLCERVGGFGVRATSVDGTQLDLVEGVFREARHLCFRDSAPQFVEVLLPRHCGHFVGDSQHYRSRTDIESDRARDCVAFYASEHEIPLDELESLQLRARDRAIEALTAALAAPMPTPGMVLQA